MVPGQNIRTGFELLPVKMSPLTNGGKRLEKANPPDFVGGLVDRARVIKIETEIVA